MSFSHKPKGRASRFTGERAEFLDAMAGEFMKSSDRGSFYSLAATRYVRKFGYAVYGESPDLDAMEPADREAELTRRKKFLPWLRTTLGGWFRHKYGGNRTDQTTLNKILQAMHKVSEQRPVKQKITHRYSQLHYKDRIKPNFDSFWEDQDGSIPKSQRLTLTQDFIQRSWASETAEFRAAFELRVEEEFQQALQEFNSRMNYSRTSSQAKLDAWHTIDSVVPNLADALGEWLGASIHIDIVAPLGSDDGQIHVKSVQSRVVGSEDDDDALPDGDTTQLLFAEWDPDMDQEHKARLAKYGMAVFSEEERENRIIRESQSHEASVDPEASADSRFKSPSPAPVRVARKIRSTVPTPAAIISDGHGSSLSSVARPAKNSAKNPTASELLDNDHRNYAASDVEPAEDGLFYFADDETVVAVAKAAVAAQVQGPRSVPSGSSDTPSAAAKFVFDILLSHEQAGSKSETSTKTAEGAPSNGILAASVSQITFHGDQAVDFPSAPSIPSASSIGLSPSVDTSPAASPSILPAVDKRRLHPLPTPISNRSSPRKRSTTSALVTRSSPRKRSAPAQMLAAQSTNELDNDAIDSASAITTSLAAQSANDLDTDAIDSASAITTRSSPRKRSAPAQLLAAQSANELDTDEIDSDSAIGTRSSPRKKSAVSTSAVAKSSSAPAKRWKYQKEPTSIGLEKSVSGAEEELDNMQGKVGKGRKRKPTVIEASEGIVEGVKTGRGKKRKSDVREDAAVTDDNTGKRRKPQADADVASASGEGFQSRRIRTKSAKLQEIDAQNALTGAKKSLSKGTGKRKKMV